MKWNVRKIKHYSHKVLNLQVYLIVLVLTHGNLQFWWIFCKENKIFITGIPFFLTLPPENEFLQTFWTINARNNEEFTIKHWEKKYVKFVKDFHGLFCINITWHYGNLNVKCFFWWYPWNIFKISEKTYFKVKTVFNQKIEAETFRHLQNHKKPLNSTLIPWSPKYPPKKQLLTVL